jgi:hypothetical protein
MWCTVMILMQSDSAAIHGGAVIGTGLCVPLHAWQLNNMHKWLLAPLQKPHGDAPLYLC